MKAKIKATGEVFNIASYATVTLDNHDSFGNLLEKKFEEVEIMQEKSSDIDWEQRRFELIKAIISGLVTHIDENFTCEGVAAVCIHIADNVLKELNKEKIE